MSMEKDSDSYMKIGANVFIKRITRLLLEEHTFLKKGIFLFVYGYCPLLNHFNSNRKMTVKVEREIEISRF